RHTRLQGDWSSDVWSSDLSDSGGGLIESAAGHFAILDGTSQGALTIAGTYQVTNNSGTFLNGTINNTGTILINAAANFTDLRIRTEERRVGKDFSEQD